jgi:hypothetical protein
MCVDLAWTPAVHAHSAELSRSSESHKDRDSSKKSKKKQTS